MPLANNQKIEAVRNQILKTKLQYQKIIDSGIIKDLKKKDALRRMLSNLDVKLQNLEAEGLVEVDSQINNEDSLSTHKRVSERSPENERLIKKITKQKMSVDEVKF